MGDRISAAIQGFDDRKQAQVDAQTAAAARHTEGLRVFAEWADEVARPALDPIVETIRAMNQRATVTVGERSIDFDVRSPSGKSVLARFLPIGDHEILIKVQLDDFLRKKSNEVTPDHVREAATLAVEHAFGEAV